MNNIADDIRGAYDDGFETGYYTAKKELERHGKWVRSKEDGFDQLVKCTACGEEFVCTELDIIDDLQWNYCPNCGARMDKE